MKLTDTQPIILNKAAQREDHAVATIGKCTAARNALDAILKAKLLKLVPKISGTAVWPGTDGEEPVSVVLTPKGLKAIDGYEVEPPQTKKPAPSITRAKRKSEAVAKDGEHLKQPTVRHTSKIRQAHRPPETPKRRQPRRDVRCHRLRIGAPFDPQSAPKADPIRLPFNL